jgi:lipoprotein signal peptidase
VKRALFAVFFVFALVAADRATKLSFMDPSASGGRSFLSGVLATTRHFNRGVIANIPIPHSIIILVTLVALAVLFEIMRRALKEDRVAHIVAISFIIAGALGNLWDRLAWKYVFDWILLFNRSVINLADIWIALGLLGLTFAPKSPILPTVQNKGEGS